MSFVVGPFQSSYSHYSSGTTDYDNPPQPGLSRHAAREVGFVGRGSAGISHSVRRGLEERDDGPPDRSHENLRHQYLRQAGFSRDIFAYLVAEKEYAFAERIDLDVPPATNARPPIGRLSVYRSWLDAVSPVVPREAVSPAANKRDACARAAQTTLYAASILYRSHLQQPRGWFRLR